MIARAVAILFTITACGELIWLFAGPSNSLHQSQISGRVSQSFRQTHTRGFMCRRQNTEDLDNEPDVDVVLCSSGKEARGNQNEFHSEHRR